MWGTEVNMDDDKLLGAPARVSVHKGGAKALEGLLQKEHLEY